MLGTAMPCIETGGFGPGPYQRLQNTTQRPRACNLHTHKFYCVREKRRELLCAVWINGHKAQHSIRLQTGRSSVVSASATLPLVRQSTCGVRLGTGVGSIAHNRLTPTARLSTSLRRGSLSPLEAPILGGCCVGFRVTDRTAEGTAACGSSSRNIREGSSISSSSDNPGGDRSSSGSGSGSSPQTESCGTLPGEEKPHNGTTAASAAAVAAVAKVGAVKTNLTSGSDADEIACRIMASRARRSTRLSYNCPACSISAATPLNIARHMARCSPDLIAPDYSAWAQLESLPRGFPSLQHDATLALLRAAGVREQELRRRMLACVFRSGPVDLETGLPKRLKAEEAASRLGLPLTRAAAVLQRAMAAVRLVSDTSGPPLDVVYEDEHFLAVNKPVGLHTAPIHRFTGGSVVNKVIAYLNQGRGGKYGSDTMRVTLLTPHPGATAVAADGSSLPPYSGSVPELMPVPEPFTLMSSGAPSSEDDLSSQGTTDCVAPQQLEPYVLHRLDMNTSGLLLFAKRQEVVAGMHRQFRERTLSKLYMAITVGCPGVGAGLETTSGVATMMSTGSGMDRLMFRVDAPIDRHPSQEVARMVASTGKEASTSFAVLANNPHADLGPSTGGTPGLLYHEHRFPGVLVGSSVSGRDGAYGAGGGQGNAPAAPKVPVIPPRGASLVLCAPHTGRTHQIRVHLHHLGHPIVGDDIYGVTGPWLDRQALHAAELHFTHPLTGRSVRLSAPLHADMLACLAALGLPQPDAAALADADWRRRLA